MSFFDTLKRGLGFGGDAAPDDTLLADTAEPVTPRHESDVEPVKFDPAQQRLIFEHVVDVFNQSLPPFLAKSIDRDAQIEYLRRGLDTGITAYLDSLAKAADRYCEARWQQTRESMKAELAALKAKAGDIERRSADMQQRQLSSDRQKRALSDRVHDLEAQLAKLEAEREQYELENRSLLNRLKVAGVQQEDVDSARAEIERLGMELRKQRENPGADAAQRADALEVQVKEMTDGIEALKEQNRVTTDMLEDMRKSLAAANKRVAERDAKIAEANETVRQVTEAIEAKMLEVDTTLADNASTIKRLNAELTERSLLIDSLNETIAKNLRLQAAREKELNRRIVKLQGAPKPTPKPAEAPVETAEAPAPVISEADLSAIEKTFESEDWLVKSPPAPTPSMRPLADPEDFGYRGPGRNSDNIPSNPSQLSLF